MLVGSWVGPQWVFWALTTMTPEERTSYRTHDECMGAIHMLLVKEAEERRKNR